MKTQLSLPIRSVATLAMILAASLSPASILPTGTFSAEIVIFNDLAERGDILSVSGIAYDPMNTFGTASMTDNGIVPINEVPTFEWEMAQTDEDDILLTFKWLASTPILAPGTLLNGRTITIMAFEFGGMDKFDAQGYLLTFGHGSSLFDINGQVAFGGTIFSGGEQLGGYTAWSLGGADITQAQWIGNEMFHQYTVVPEPATFVGVGLGLAALLRRRKGVQS